MTETVKDGGPAEFRGSVTLKDGSRVRLTADEAKSLWEQCEKHKQEVAERLPDEQAALRAMSEAHHRLKDFGWRDAIYCPKDGTFFQVIEAGSSGIHHCRYNGEWPDGRWWIHDGDIWPSRPTLFRLYPEDEAKRKEKMADALLKARGEGQ